MGILESRPKVWWGSPLGETIHWRAHNALMGVAQSTPWPRLETPRGTVDEARNRMTDLFCEVAGPDDYMVMLDADHIHPKNVVMRLVAQAEAHNFGIVGALAMMRRPEKPLPMMFMHKGGNKWDVVTEWPEGEIVVVDFVPPCAIAIARWVFDKLKALDFGPPFWRYVYTFYPEMPKEDFYFAEKCIQARIPMACDTSLEVPHLFDGALTSTHWKRWVAAHPGEE